MSQETTESPSNTDLLQMTTEVVAAYVGHNRVEPDRVSQVVQSVYHSLVGLDGRGDGGTKAKQKPAVPIKRSITDDYVICLEDGKKLKMLKRHLRTSYSLSPEAYRAKWGLASDYPMVAPNYAKVRSAFAKKIGLGKRRSQLPSYPMVQAIESSKHER